RLAIALHGDERQPLGEQLLDAVEQYVAARLRDVEQADRAGDVLAARGELASHRCAFVRRVEDDRGRLRRCGHGTSSITRLVGIDPPGPLAQPSKIIENFPASEPATAM